MLNRYMAATERLDGYTTRATNLWQQTWSSTTSSANHSTATDRRDTNIPHDVSASIQKQAETSPHKKNQPRLQHENGQEYSHMQFLTRILEREKDCEPWERVAAQSRVMSFPILLAQLVLQRRAVIGTAQGDELLKLLPCEAEMEKRIGYFDKKGHPEKGILRSYAHILAADTDNLRCQRLLEHGGQVPVHLLLFLLRPNSQLRDIPTLRGLIDRYKPTEALSLKTIRRSSDLWSQNYLRILPLLGRHLARTEPRLLVELADAAAAYLRKFVEVGDSHKRYVSCCQLFNTMLQIFQPESNLFQKQLSVANAYFWECQRLLLTTSETFERPLLVTGGGFRAIRSTLAGMPKNEAEKHSALLHAPSWPPYLTPGDGMDEITDPESNWSRTVEAGMLMQEAGFAKSEADDSLDILKGMAPDGTPTIQQRMLAATRPISTWEASIRATRDTHEAWGRFNEPPTKGAVPGINEYAAMFQKLMLREAASTTKVLPGDKAQNFPAHRAANLTDIEWAKSRPPSVEELYDQMNIAGIIPSGHCLSILVANAPDIETAHRYLKSAAELDPNISSLIAPRIEPSALCQVGNGLFAAYINMLARRDDRSGWENLQRAIALADARLGVKRSRWSSLVWGSILKGASRHHSALRMSQPDQVELLMAIAKRMERGRILNLANFSELNKSLRKMIRYNLSALAEQLQSTGASTVIPSSKLPLWELYETINWRDDEAMQAGKHEQRTNPAAGSLMSLVQYIKGVFAASQTREASFQASSHDSYIPPLDRMLSRNDVVKSEHALEYMMAMGYAGEFQEMKKLLQFLIREWSQPDLVQGVADLYELPPSADFTEVLCVFRLLGEPMLGGLAVAEEMQDAIVKSGLPWTWPDAAAVQAYLQMQPNDSIRQVQSIHGQMRTEERRAAQAQAQAQTTLDDSTPRDDENSQALGSNEADKSPDQAHQGR
ncbi:hypothetical protein NLG97_g1385 [Lecanicillium saksenae]|uniref:Uncharacterized protein n=1 Tax=Lecanicillium saksenae TaxID=468837 RepID=A0ACC1R3W5_9HYPO|nr:hypothetical protein NLG97_g1385 [Lecanicillium saksenae]